MKNIKIKKLVKDILFYFITGILAGYAAITVSLLSFDKRVNLVVTSYVIIFAILLSILAITFSGVDKYKKKDCDVYWIPVEKEQPQDCNKNKAKMCLIKEENSTYREVLLLYKGSGKWMLGDRDITNRVVAWERDVWMAQSEELL